MRIGSACARAKKRPPERIGRRLEPYSRAWIWDTAERIWSAGTAGGARCRSATVNEDADPVTSRKKTMIDGGNQTVRRRTQMAGGRRPCAAGSADEHYAPAGRRSREAPAGR